VCESSPGELHRFVISRSAAAGRLPVFAGVLSYEYRAIGGRFIGGFAREMAVPDRTRAAALIANPLERNEMHVVFQFGLGFRI
jgi:hypothetical protein